MPISESEMVLKFDASNGTRCSKLSILTSYANPDKEQPEVFHIRIVDHPTVPPATVVILESRKLLSLILHFKK